MLKWFGRRAHQAKPNEATPAFLQAREVVSIVAELDSLKGLTVVTDALAALTNRPLLLSDRFDEIHVLDAAGQRRLFELIKEYLATPRHRKSRESELWGGAYRYLQELYLASLLSG